MEKNNPLATIINMKGGPKIKQIKMEEEELPKIP